VRVLWAPWRLSYLESDSPDEGCIFCVKPRLETAAARRDALVLYSQDTASVLMNRYPYAHAHLMVAPREHTANFASLEPSVAAGVQLLLQRTVAVLEKAYTPAGFNIGVNLGRAAGAGIADHMHWHVVPRWQGDTNFMPMLADTRVISQHLVDAYDRLLPLFGEATR
jgi:ATP adenylyltransferase